MALTMKERYSRLNLSKVSDDLKNQFEEIKNTTENFSDQDIVSLMEDEFNENYKLVEKHFPDAINTGAKKIKREKPAKIKKVKDRTKLIHEYPHVKPYEAKEMLEKLKKDKEVKKLTSKLSDEQIDEIEDIFLKTEQLDDKGLKMVLVATVGLSENQAEKWVKQRDKFLKSAERMKTKYSERKKAKKTARKEKDVVETRDGYKFNRKDPDMKGKKFFDENGKQWTCKGYSVKLDECIMEDSKGKEITSCLKDMYVNNPVSKREKGNMVDECRDVLKEAGYTVKEHKAGKKKIRRKAPRPEKEIIKERVEDTFTPITKDLTSSEEKTKENKEVIESLDRIQKLFVKVFNRISNLADDGQAKKLEKIEKLLKELVGE